MQRQGEPSRLRLKEPALRARTGDNLRRDTSKIRVTKEDSHQKGGDGTLLELGVTRVRRKRTSWTKSTPTKVRDSEI